MCEKCTRLLLIVLVGLFVSIASSPEGVWSQESFPSKPITMIIDQGPGGQNDVITRALSKAAEKELGKPIVCENRPGGGMIVARNYVLKSKPDGYTLGTGGSFNTVTWPHMQKLPFDVMTDQVDIAVYFKYTHALCVRSDAPWKTIEDIVAYARKNPGKFTYGTAGVGNTQHIVMERIAKKVGIKWSQVPFKSGSEPVLACLGGHVDAVAQGPADVIPHIQAGKLRMILGLNDNRWAIAPDIPDCLEKYGFYGRNYKTIIGPKGIPDQVVEKLNNAFKKAVDDPSYVQLCKALQVERYYMSGKDISKLWRSEYDEVGQIIKELGIVSN